MITAEMREEAKDFLIKAWREDGEKVIGICQKAKPFDGNSSQFLSHCTACGGNWGGMFLTGIRELWPEVWEVIPEKMGSLAFVAICNTLILCGVDTTE